MRIIRLIICFSYLLPFIFLAYGCEGDDLIPFYKEEEFEDWRRNHSFKNPVEEFGGDSVISMGVDTTSVINENGIDTTSVINENEIDTTDQKSERTGITTSPPTTGDFEKDYFDLIPTILVFPTESSLSGIGVMILYQSNMGRAAIFISFLGSAIILILSFMKKKKPRAELIIQTISILNLLLFIWISIFLVRTDLLSGFWLCLLLNSISMVWTFKKYRLILISKNT